MYVNVKSIAFNREEKQIYLFLIFLMYIMEELMRKNAL